MQGFLSAILHRIPAVPVQVERRGFQEKEQAVQEERREKDIRQVVHELWIECDQEEQQNSAE